MIRVLVVDDHPAVRSGLLGLLQIEPGIVPVAAAAGMRDALEEAARWKPSVAVVDFDLGPDGDGLDLCRRLRARDDPPRVVVYSAFAGASLSVAALIADAAAVVSKAAPPDDLFAAVRTVAGGGKLLPGLTHEAIRHVGARVSERDRPIFGMLLDGTPHSEIASTLGVTRHELDERLGAMLEAVGNRHAAARAAH